MSMPQDFPKISALIESGEIDQVMREFMEFAVFLRVGLRTGQVAELPGMRATVIAAELLQELANTTDGRRLLRRRASNKVYNADDQPLTSPHLDIARRLGSGLINRDQAIAELRTIFAQADIHPTDKTLDSYLGDLEERARDIRGALDIAMRAAGWDGNPATIEAVAKTIISGNRPKDA